MKSLASAAWVFGLVVGCGGAVASSPEVPASAQPASAEPTPAEASGPALEATPQHDFELICHLAQNPELDMLAPEIRGARLAEDIDTQVTNHQVRRVFEVVASADPPQRYMTMQRGALELGVPDWQCPAFEQRITPTQ